MKLADMLKKERSGTGNKRESRSSLNKEPENPFAFSEERSRGFTMVQRPRGNSQIIVKDNDDMNRSKQVLNSVLINY